MIYTGWLRKRLVIDWEPHRLLEIYENVVSITSKSNRITCVYLRKKHTQESIFGSDGFEDVKRECAKSGEPLLTSMRLENEIRFPPIPPYVWTLVGEPKMRSTDEVKSCIGMITFHLCMIYSYGNSYERRRNCGSHT